MCWSAQASIISFIIGWSLSIFLIIRNKPFDRVWGLFFLFVTLMQFFEFLIWLDQPKEGQKTCESGKYKGKLNNVASHISSIQNLAQPLVAFLLALFFIPSDKLFINHKILAILSLIYFIALVVWIFTNKLFKHKLCTIPCDGCNNHHLQWQWTDENYAGKYIWPMYFIGLILIMFGISKVRGGFYLGLFLIIIASISASLYPFKKAFGSWWCVAAILGPLIKIFIPTDKLNENIFN